MKIKTKRKRLPRPRCECYRKPGAFQFAPAVWTQCENPATKAVYIDKRYVDGIHIAALKTFACDGCYQEFLKRSPNVPHRVTHKIDLRIRVRRKAA
jgi:hypothetical protein